MTASEARREVADFIAKILEHGLGVGNNPPVIRMQGGFTFVIWSSARGYPPATYSAPYGTIGEYRKLVEDRQYNLMLYDGSLIQALFVFRRNELIKHCLSYYPCPVRLSTEDASGDVPLGEVVDHHLLHALESLEWLQSLDGSMTENVHGGRITEAAGHQILHMRAPIRFDFDPDSQGPLHTASHMHIGDPESRVPVYAPMSFGHFVRFIFRNFYRPVWLANPFLYGWPIRQQECCITEEEEEDLFLDCRI